MANCTCPRCLADMRFHAAVNEPDVNVVMPALWSCGCGMILEADGFSVYSDEQGDYADGTGFSAVCNAEEAKARAIREKLAEDAVKRDSLKVASIVGDTLGWSGKPGAISKLADDILRNGGKL
jgi:hypothetical protein